MTTTRRASEDWAAGRITAATNRTAVPRAAAAQKTSTAGPRMFIVTSGFCGLALAAAGLFHADQFPVGPITAMDALLGGAVQATGSWLIYRATRAVSRRLPAARTVSYAERHRLGSVRWKDSYDR